MKPIPLTETQMVELFRLRKEVAELKRQLEDDRNLLIGIESELLNVKYTGHYYAGIRTIKQQLAESQAREARLLKFIDEVAKQTPEKPDYWSSCSQCERNSSEAEDYVELPHDDTALNEYRDAVIEKCAVIAANSCLMPPDGGSPTAEEAAVSEEAARRIRTMRTARA